MPVNVYLYVWMYNLYRDKLNVTCVMIRVRMRMNTFTTMH